jgi:hypothetical protein
MTDRTCQIDFCDKPTRTQSADLCGAHYHRWYRLGDPLGKSPWRGKDIAGQRFGALVAVRPAPSEGWHCQCDCGGERTARTFALTAVAYPTCDAPVHKGEVFTRLHGKPLGPKGHAKVCERCAVPFSGWKASRFCGRLCATAWRGELLGVQHADDGQSRYRLRARSAPGLNGYKRGKLLVKWKREGRICAYCQSPADTLDHVLPLIRGGTNYEGNLAPACRSCNSSKSSKTITEWRYARRTIAADLPQWVHEQTATGPHTDSQLTGTNQSRSAPHGQHSA